MQEREIKEGGVPNPANVKGEEGEKRIRRVPMSAPVQRLQVEPIDGFHLHWFAESRVERAKQAGYELVHKGEVSVNSRQIGSPKSLGGSTDLGDCVSIVGGEVANGTVERLVLMKLKQEWWEEDKKLLDQRNAQIMGSIFEGEAVGGKDGNTAPLPDHAYAGNRSMNIKPVLNRGIKRAQPGRRGN